MIGRTITAIGLAALALSLALVLGSATLASNAPAQQKQQPPLKLGMVSSLFHDLPDSKVQALLPELQNLMREQTGLQGEVLTAGDAQDLGKQLNDNAVQLGVFHGFEFAWARQSYPKLKPLLIAVNRQQHSLKAFVAVLDENKATALADLKGKVISIPERCPAHCLLFLERELSAMGIEQKDFFSKVVHHTSVEDALDDILRDKVQAALVDGAGLANYDQVKPGCFVRLKMLKQAEGFPPGVVAFREGALDEATLAKFKAGMIGANTTTRGKEQMAQWKLTAFEGVPADFEAMAADILKRYPAAKGKTSQ